MSLSGLAHRLTIVTNACVRSHRLSIALATFEDSAVAMRHVITDLPRRRVIRSEWWPVRVKCGRDSVTVSTTFVSWSSYQTRCNKQSHLRLHREQIRFQLILNGVGWMVLTASGSEKKPLLDKTMGEDGLSLVGDVVLLVDVRWLHVACIINLRGWTARYCGCGRWSLQNLNNFSFCCVGVPVYDQARNFQDHEPVVTTGAKASLNCRTACKPPRSAVFRMHLYVTEQRRS
jgi:hypothetical protein